MRRILPKSIDLLIDKLSQLPGIGPKSASRLTFTLLQRPDAYITDLSNALTLLKENLHYCPRCFLITDQKGECVICQDLGREQAIVCVVETSLDVVAIEQSASFKGLYHVLGGALSPLEGLGPDQLHIKELLDRVKNEQKIRELIMATNPSLEGEATALYINDKLKNTPVTVTRIARGLPIGGSLEYADEVTLARALEGRQNIADDKEDHG